MSSSSTLSTKLSTEFYIEYLRILQSIQNPKRYNNTLVIESASPKIRKRSSKIRRTKGVRPKSAPGLRKISKINKGRRGTVDPDKLISIRKKSPIEHFELRNNKSFIEARKSYSPWRTKKLKSNKRKSPKKVQVSQNQRINEASEEDSFHEQNWLNFKFETFSQKKQLITLQQARAAFFIFVMWRIYKYFEWNGRPKTKRNSDKEWDEIDDIQRHNELN